MPNRRLKPDELIKANHVLDQIRASINDLSSGDPELLFAYRRRLIVKLTHDERGTPAERNKLKAEKRIQQKGICPLCSEPLPEKYVELDRTVAYLGYTPENTRLIHHQCHIEDQARKSYL
jgi:hypothetical protein